MLCAVGSLEREPGAKLLHLKSMLKLNMRDIRRVASSALLGTEAIMTFSSVFKEQGTDGSCIDKRGS